MADYVAFLTARYDEVEERVREWQGKLDSDLPIPASMLGGIVNPERAFADIAAKRAIVADYQADIDRHADHYAAQLARPASELHAGCVHPGYEYVTTEGPRKRWDDADTPPDETWERNGDRGIDGWERFEHVEESYWRRPRPDGPRGPYVPPVPSHIRHLASVYADHPDHPDNATQSKAG